MTDQNLSQRKSDHIRINLERDVASRITSGLEAWRFGHEALPELNLADVDLSVEFLGRSLRAPLLISSMTGGTEEARRINLNLAAAAEKAGIAIGLGSMRAAIARPDSAPTFQIREAAPSAMILANVGAVQFNYGFGLDECRRLVDLAGADALILHLNPLQEALQPEGDTNWSGLLRAIERICRQLSVPVVAKEVGWGISERAAGDLARAGVAAIDVAGAGGTSWSQVEMYRAQTETQRRIAAAFGDWGLPTAESVQQARQGAPGLPIIASGGITNGVEGAKCIALGASLFGLARPFLRAATESAGAVSEEIDVIVGQLRIAMFCVAARRVGDLQRVALTRTRDR
ncbi:MAG: type 2 isopentenyl-diphosphate Delta-isomerase [Thermoflexales bacterium]|jgi:isopentenyl-diphosphate delta-isomerase|nr:type 2 isopentenyl-diphosphate Delta-isomerase [Thermoflexales bacterium]MBP8241197.1 type 2 isopentenyl-diphosphate Delta-isomerase [Thermoflexales bacterium]